MKICSAGHGNSVWKEGISKKTDKPYGFWACPTKLPDGTFCKAEQVESQDTEPFLNQPDSDQQKATDQEKAMWAEKDRQSMAQTAMKSASEIVAALITVKDYPVGNVSSFTKTMANDYYKELKKMKGEE